MSRLARPVRRPADRWRSRARRTTPGALLVRGLLLLSALVMFGLATPPELLLRAAPLVVLGAAVVTLAPRTGLVTLALLGAAGGWVFTTIVSETAVGTWRLAALTAAMYLVHAAAAFAAVLPHDAVVDQAAVLWWLLRVGVVACASAGVAVAAVAGAARLPGRPMLLAALAGVVVVGVLVRALGRMARR